MPYFSQVLDNTGRLTEVWKNFFLDWMKQIKDGAVSNISGTLNRIIVSGTQTAPVVNISPSYVGQTSITTLGTISAGTWNGSAVAAPYGGTGQTSYLLGDMLYGSGPMAISKLPGIIATSRHFMSQTGAGSTSAAPAWNTAVDPLANIPGRLIRGTTAGDIAAVGGQIILESGDNFAAVISALGSTPAQIMIAGQVSITSNLTVPRTIALSCPKCALPNFDIATSVELTLNASLEAGLYRIFSGDGVVGGNPLVVEIFPEWWGAVGDGDVVLGIGVGTDDSGNIQKALDFVRDNYDLGAGGAPDIRFTNSYLCNSGIQVPTRVNLVGAMAHVAGNLNRNTSRLIFRNLGMNTEAITIGSDVELYGLVISGPGEGIGGTFGIYGGIDSDEDLGSNTQIRFCTIEDFETGIVLSRWLNTIADCTVDDCITGIWVTDRGNHTVIRDNRINPGSESPKEGILISGIADGIFIHDNNIEAVYYGIVIVGGAGIEIHDNRFELTNKSFIDVRGTGNASDENISVQIHHNYMLDYGANASSGGRYGILVQAGRVTIDDNEIRYYDSGNNTGLQYGINFGGTGILVNVLIGRNHIDCFQAMANINDSATKERVTSRFSRTIECLWDLADDPGDNVEHYFRVPSPSGYSALYSFRQLGAFNLEALSAAIGEITIGYRGASADLDAYLDGFGPSSTAVNTVTYATDTEWTAGGTTFLALSDSRIYLIRMEPGSAVSGKILLTLTLDEFQF